MEIEMKIKYQERVINDMVHFIDTVMVGVSTDVKKTINKKQRHELIIKFFQNAGFIELKRQPNVWKVTDRFLEAIKRGKCGGANYLSMMTPRFKRAQISNWSKRDCCELFYCYLCFLFSYEEKSFFIWLRTELLTITCERLRFQGLSGQARAVVIEYALALQFVIHTHQCIYDHLSRIKREKEKKRLKRKRKAVETVPVSEHPNSVNTFVRSSG